MLKHIAAASALALSALATANVGELPPVSQASYRYLGMIHLFDATFHAAPETMTDDPLADFPKSLEFEYHRKLTRSQLIAAADKILQKTFAPQELARIESQLAQINAAYQDVGKSDRYQLRYHPQQGTTLARNGQDVLTIPGAEFQRIYFAIWLGPRSPFAFKPLYSGNPAPRSTPSP